MSDPTTPQPIDLTSFCSRSEMRPTLATPFSIGEETFATDGKIIIAVPRRADVPERADAPNDRILEILTEEKHDGNFRDLPPFQLPETKPCEDCHGYGYFLFGDGVTRWECEECEGGTIFPAPVGVAFGNQIVNEYLLVKIAALPNVKLANSTREAGALTFTFDGGHGLVMPMRK